MPAKERFDVLPRKAAAPRKPRLTPEGPGEGKYDRRRTEIIEAAVAPMNANGVKGMTLADVGARLNLAPTAAGYYFKKKEDLAVACYLRSIERMRRLLTDVWTMGPPEQAPQNFIRRSFEFRRQVETGQESEIAWFEDVRAINDPAVGAAYTAMFRATRDLFGAWAGDCDRMALNARTHLLLHQFYWAVGWLDRYHADDYPRIAERMIDILEKGLASPGRPWSPRPLTVVPMGADPGDLTREAYLSAATELINEEGYLGASIQKISARLNATRGAFYHHHDAKDDLVSRCFERTWAIIRQMQIAADETTSNGLDNLSSVAVSMTEGQMTGAMALLRASALSAVPSGLRPEFIRGHERITSRYACVISDGIADGSLRSVDVLVATQMIASALDAGAGLESWTPGLAPEQATALFIKPLFQGVLRRS